MKALRTWVRQNRQVWRHRAEFGGYQYLTLWEARAAQAGYERRFDDAEMIIKSRSAKILPLALYKWVKVG